MGYKACPRCGRIHPAGYRCNVGRMPRVHKDMEEHRLRSTQAWTDKSREVRDKAHGLCEVCRDRGIYNYRGVEVHHIVKLRDNPSGLLDNLNLVCLCQLHHKQADRGQIDPSYLRELAAKRENES